MKEFLPKSAAKMADCLMKRYGLLTSRWSYDYGVAWRGMEALYAMTGEKKYFDYIKDAMATHGRSQQQVITNADHELFRTGPQCVLSFKSDGIFTFRSY